MRVAFYASDKPREQILARAFINGVVRQGDKGTIISRGAFNGSVGKFDVVGFYGVKSLRLFDAHREADIHTLMFDKGYIRRGISGTGREYTRVAVDGHHPDLSLKRYPKDRFERLGLSLSSWRKKGRHIVLFGSSAKYHNFYGLPGPTVYAEAVIRVLRQYTDRPIIYRPKPTWRAAQPVEGASYSPAREPLDRVLSGAWAVVTHGSNACFEAVLSGVPCIVLGRAIARSISSTRLSDIESPRLALIRDRRQWFANLAYHQWTFSEFNSGQAWEAIRCEISP